MFVKIPQETGARYVDLDYVTYIQLDDNVALFFFRGGEVTSITFKDTATAEDVVEGMFYCSNNLYVIDEDDIGEDD